MNQDSQDSIAVSQEAEVAIVTIDNPQRRNAMSRQMRQQFRATIDRLLTDEPDCRAIVITGAGDHFSAGADISEMTKRTITQSRQILAEFVHTVRSMTSGQKPIIAAVEGIAFGLGMSLACAADYVVAGSASRFCAAFLRIGLIPDTGILWTLPRKVGPAKARELLSLASEIDAAEAYRIGLVNTITEPGQALTEAIKIARQFAQNPPMSMALIKSALTYGSLTLDDSLQTEIDYQPILRATEDNLEAANAFMEKRKPRFTGR